VSGFLTAEASAKAVNRTIPCKGGFPRSARFRNSRPAAEHARPCLLGPSRVPIGAGRGIGRTLGAGPEVERDRHCHLRRLQMFDRTQLYLGVAFIGMFELGIVLVRTVVR
jgi:hypothetical protein